MRRRKGSAHNERGRVVGTSISSGDATDLRAVLAWVVGQVHLVGNAELETLAEQIQRYQWFGHRVAALLQAQSRGN